MKKALAFLLALAMSAAVFASCGKGAEDTTTASTETTVQTTTTEQTTTETTTASAESTSTETSASSTEETTAESTSAIVPETPKIEDYEKNLVMYLDFEEWDNGKVTDVSGNGHDALAFGEVSKTESHDASSAAKFGANGDYFVVKNSDDLNFTATDSYTLSLWYCFDENTVFTKWPCVLNKGLTDDSKDCYAVLISSSSSNKGINFSVSAQPIKGNVNINASSDMTLNQWHHFVAVQDAEKGTVTTYVDGKRGGYITYPADATTPTDLFIGAMGEKVGQRQFLGKLDDIKIYDCALSEAVIQGFVEEAETLLIDMDFEGETGGILNIGKTLTLSAEPDGFYAGEGFTLSVRFKRSGTGVIVKKDAADGTYGFSIDEQNRLIMHVGAGKYYADQAIDNAWHYAVMIQNPESRTLLFYLDGVLQGSTKPANQLVPSASRDLVGTGDIIVNDAQGQIEIDDLKLYNYAVSESEILAGYQTADAMGREIFSYEDSTTGEKLDLPYRVYLPSDYDEASDKQYPILFFLHGHGETGMDNTQNVRVNGGENKLFNDLIAKDNIIIVAPQATCDDGGNREWFSSSHGWKNGSRAELPETPTLAMRAAMALLDEYLANDKVDTKRVYAGGISMGGYGTWELITRKSDVFAAAIPLCGAGIPSEAANLKDIAIWAFHGTADSTVPMSGTSDMEAAIKAAGGTKMKATYLQGVGHSCWDNAYATEGLVDWLLSQTK
ncbi:MAG: dienelactone hydrolase family protein [Clostridia bacterium]|nr:dienelactone hydrolase family protein [Clostridia bacterium]